MPSYRFYQVDVFTDVAFGGNPLAVFPDAAGLETANMQRIAREMNLSETTFVFPSDKANFKVRIFTPGTELPFAGHPVIGTHWVLANLGKVSLQEPVTKVSFELGVGVRAAALHIQGGKVVKVVMDHQKPEFYAKANAGQVADLERALKIDPGAIWATGWPVQVVSTGIRQLFVPLRSLTDIQYLSPNNMDVQAVAELCATLDPVEQCNQSLLFLTLDTTSPQINVHTRMFAPAIGVPEDPATGSASGGLGAYLIENGIIPATLPTTRIMAEQGLEMQRPSKIDIEVDGNPGNITMIRVGGQVVPLIEGMLSW